MSLNTEDNKDRKDITNLEIDYESDESKSDQKIKRTLKRTHSVTFSSTNGSSEGSSDKSSDKSSDGSSSSLPNYRKKKKKYVINLNATQSTSSYPSDDLPYGSSSSDEFTSQSSKSPKSKKRKHAKDVIHHNKSISESEQATKTFIVLGGVILVGLFIVACYFFGLYIIQDQKCPYDTMSRSKDVLCEQPVVYNMTGTNGTVIEPAQDGKCERYFRTYSDMYTVCIQSRRLKSDIILDADCPTDDSYYCRGEYSIEAKIGMTVLGLFALAFCLLLWATAFMGTFLPAGAAILFESSRISKKLGVILGLIFNVCLITLTMVIFIPLMAAMNGVDGTECKFYERCVGSYSYGPGNCNDSDQYCYIDDFKKMPWWFWATYQMALTCAWVSLGAVIGLSAIVYGLGRWIRG